MLIRLGFPLAQGPDFGLAIRSGKQLASRFSKSLELRSPSATISCTEGGSLGFFAPLPSGKGRRSSAIPFMTLNGSAW